MRVHACTCTCTCTRLMFVSSACLQNMALLINCCWCFSASMEGAGTPCVFEYFQSDAESGTFTSPNYPGNYPRSTECHYLFMGTEGTQVFIQFKYFDVDGVMPGWVAAKIPGIRDNSVKIQRLTLRAPFQRRWTAYIIGQNVFRKTSIFLNFDSALFD